MYVLVNCGREALEEKEWTSLDERVLTTSRDYYIN
jgi:hypothetical protein